MPHDGREVHCGRQRLRDVLHDGPRDFSAGLILHKKYGDEVKEGDSLVTLYTSKESALADAEKMYREAIAIGDEQPVKEPLVYARVEKDKVEKY